MASLPARAVIALIVGGAAGALGAAGGLGAAGCGPGSEPRPPRPAPEAAAADDPARAGEAPPPAPVDPRKETVELAFAGDVMFGRFVEGGFRPIAVERHDVWAEVRSLLDSDFTMVNLETPLLRDPPPKSRWGHDKRFVGTPARVATLAAANIDAVTLANNHAYDMKLQGLVETPAILDELGIVHVGASRADLPALRAETVVVEGWRVAFVPIATIRNARQRAGEPELPYAEWNQVERAVLPVVRAARPDHDLVIVVAHWGLEYKDHPEGWRVSAARAWIDAGADLVIGHHPHVLQGIERHGDGLIAYSLGNFLFDNLSGVKRLHGVLRVTFRRGDDRGGCLDAAAFHPTVGTRPHFAPVPAGKELKRVAERLRTLSTSKPLRRTTWRIDGDRLVADGACPSPPG